MARPTDADELFVHQVPQLLDTVATRDDHWRESYFFDIHDPAAGPDGDVVFFTVARYPSHDRMDSLQMGRVGGERVFGIRDRRLGDDPHTTTVDGAGAEVVEPWRTIRLHADPAVCAIGVDLTFTARTAPYGLRRGTLRDGDDVIWDQCHILQSGIYHGTFTVAGTTREVDGWVGQRDHSWGIRDHGRCPLWLWFQLQLDDGFLGIWHWEHANGALVYSDGCWAPADGGDPVPVIRFDHDVDWVGADGRPVDAYGEHGEGVAGLAGSCRFTLEGGRQIVVEAEGTFACPYEPFQRGGLNLMTVRTDDGRAGTAIYEVTGSRHHRFFR